MILKNGEAWDEVFRAGKHVDSNGVTRSYTEADLDKIASSYDARKHEAPIVVGHPKDNAPAFGWVESLKREGTKLLAKYKQISPDFTQWAQQGLYKKKSIALYPDMSLRHVGYLGAQPPAIKGLPDFAFEEGSDPITIEFMEDSRMSVLQRLMRRMREYLFAKDGVPKADETIPEWELGMLDPSEEPNATPSFKEPDMNVQELQAKLDAEIAARQQADAAFAESEAKRKTAEEENARLLDAQNKADRDARRASATAFAESLVKESKIAVVAKADVVDFMEALHEAGEVEFSEGEARVKKSAVERFKSLLQSFPPRVEFAEVATRENAGSAGSESAEAVAIKAAQYREEQTKAGNHISFTEAVGAVSKK
jgi:hypothetical protein